MFTKNERMIIVKGGCNKHWGRAMLAALILAAIVALGSSASGQSPIIIEYGQNAPDWNQKLGINATRGSCTLAPAECVKNATVLLNGQHTKSFYLNVEEDPQKVTSYAAQEAKASLSEPRIVELGFDDFIDHFNIWCKTFGNRCSGVMGEIIRLIKTNNPALKVGVTIYEDQLASLLANPNFTPALRSQIDNVHLYLHNRNNGPQFAKYVNQIKRNFSNAAVIAGTYPYDRVDYIKCDNATCSAAQELNLYKQTLGIQLQLLKKGDVAGIEFYPGHFGWEEKWNQWNNAKVCKANRQQECIDNTRAMHQATLQLFHEFGLGTQ